MLNMKKLNEKIIELKAQKLSNYIEWEEELPRLENPLTDGIAVGNCRPPQRFRLQEISLHHAKLFMYNYEAEMFEGVMVVEK